jgi:hypothetical protein
MAICDVCGNEYDKAFQVTQAGKTMTFDSLNVQFMRWHRAVLTVSAS